MKFCLRKMSECVSDRGGWNGGREWRGRFAMKKRANCSPKVSRVGCVLMVSIGGRSEVGVEVGIDKELTCLGLWKIEQKSLASAIFASSETVGKDSSR